jgi:hypothetical protein
MVTYVELKAKVIEVLDDFAKKDEVIAGYGTKYTAKSKLDELGITEPVRAVMPKRFNKDMRKLVGSAWKAVGPTILAEKETIGDIITLACGQSAVPLPQGEPT